MLKMCAVFGTRPEAIPANCAGLCKLAPVIRELRRYPGRVVCKVCVIAQHRQMLDQVLRLFGIVLDYPSARLPSTALGTGRTGAERSTLKEEAKWMRLCENSM
jgi:UDP-N-acetylglucosamine 2-epimerase